MLLHDSAAANNVDLATLGQVDCTVANDGQPRSPRRTSNNTRDVARANRAALTVPEQRSHSCFDASVGRDHSGREPPPAAAFTQGNFGIVNAPATASKLGLVHGIANSAARGHQLVHQLASKRKRDSGIGGPPASTVDGDESSLGRIDVVYSHTPSLTCRLDGWPEMSIV